MFNYYKVARELSYEQGQVVAHEKRLARIKELMCDAPGCGLPFSLHEPEDGKCSIMPACTGFRSNEEYID